MEGSDILQTIAEVSIALTGFTGIVVAFGRFAPFLAAPMWLLGFSALSFSRLLLTILEQRHG